MSRFDLAKTSELFRLCAIPHEARDAAWLARFYAAAPDASLKGETPQAIAGPDGFPYFVLKLPEEGVPFEAYCISHIVDFCLENGLGAVLNPQKERPDYVFTFGNLWSWKATGQFVRELPPGAPPGVTKETVDGEREVLVAQPSEDFFPGFARRAVDRFLRHRLGVAEPGCFLLGDPTAIPTQSLVFNVFSDGFESEKDFANAMYFLRWYLPGDYSCTAIPRNSDLASHFAPLVG